MKMKWRSIIIILDLILGKNIDTFQWIHDLKELDAEYIAVLDYDIIGDYEVFEEIIYMSVDYATKYVQEFHSVNFYKSLYVYPGMGGCMSSLQKKDY